MKKFLSILGGLFLVSLLVIGGFAGYTTLTGSSLDDSSKKFIDQNIPSIIQDWNRDTLINLASSDLKIIANDTRYEKLFGMFCKLGRMKTYKGSQGESRIMLTGKAGKVVSATYLVAADFENGSANIQVGLIQQDGKWRINMFRVNSDLFLEIFQ